MDFRCFFRIVGERGRPPRLFVSFADITREDWKQ